MLPDKKLILEDKCADIMSVSGAVDGWADDIYPAMDEYARQVAIGFAKFIVDGGWDKVAGDNYGEAFFVNPPEELFELYRSKL